MTRQRFFFILLFSAIFLVLADLAGKISTHFFGHDHVLGLIPLFDLNVEGNIPTWFSSTLLLIAAYLLWLIGSATQDRDSRYWKILSLIFIYISLDEACGIHDKFSPWLRYHWKTTGYLHYAWVIPALIFVFILLAIYARFLLRLPARTRQLFIAAGILYVGAAAGLECVEGFVASTIGKSNFQYLFLLTVEESLEMAGLLFFIYALLEHQQEI